MQTDHEKRDAVLPLWFFRHDYIFRLGRATNINGFPFFFFAVPMACRNSWARDQTHTTAVTGATAVTMPDP